MAEQEEDLELKKRARRRLVGAIAFALLAVALLPLVMDEEAPRVGADIAIRIPGQNEVRDTPLVATPENRRDAAPAQAPVNVPATDAKPEAKSEVKPEVKVEPPAAGPATSSTKADEAKAARSGESPRPIEKDNSPAVEKDSQRVQAILDGKPDEVQYVLLIGAYANASNVTALTQKLADLGVKTYTESVSLPQGKRTRVRAGPFPTRDAAEAAQAKMKRIGVNGQIAVRP